MIERSCEFDSRSAHHTRMAELVDAPALSPGDLKVVRVRSSLLVPSGDLVVAGVTSDVVDWTPDKIERALKAVIPGVVRVEVIGLTSAGPEKVIVHAKDIKGVRDRATFVLRKIYPSLSNSSVTSVRG